MIALLVLAASMNAFAVTYTAKATVTLTSANSNVCVLTLGQSDALGVGVTPACSEMNMEGRLVAFYALNGTTKYQIFMNKSLGNLPLGLMTDGSASYTISVSGVLGTETLVLKDNETGDLVNLTEGATYNFTATSSTDSRFQLYVAPPTPEICHRYGKLQVSGSNGQNVVVKNMDDSATSIGTVAITADYQEIDLAGLAAGQYKVEWNSQTLIIDVK